MSDKIERWEPEIHGLGYGTQVQPTMRSRHNGEYVLYSDHERAIQAAEARGAERMRERCAEQAIAYMSDYRNLLTPTAVATALAALPLEEGK